MSHPALLDTDVTLATVYLGVLSSALLTGIFGNIMILMVAGWARGLNKVGKEFMVNLALADLCVTGIAEPMCIIGVVKGEAFFTDKPVLCELVASMCLTACFCAFMNLSMLSTNRYIYLCHNSIYDRLYGRKRCIFFCFVCWVIAFLFEFPNFIGWGDHYFDQKNHQCIWDRTSSKSYTFFVALGLIGFPLVVMSVCFILIFRHIWKTKKNLHNIDTEKCERMTKVMKDTMRASTTIFFIFVVFVVCWTPYAIVIILDMENKMSVTIHLFVTLLAHTHSSCNFFIYFITNKRFRSVLARIWGCRTLAFTSESDHTKSSPIPSLSVENSKKVNSFSVLTPQLVHKSFDKFADDPLEQDGSYQSGHI